MASPESLGESSCRALKRVIVHGPGCPLKPVRQRLAELFPLLFENRSIHQAVGERDHCWALAHGLATLRMPGL